MNKLACFVLPGLVLLAACSSSTTPQSDRNQMKQGAQGQLKIFITDAPLEVEKLVVYFSEIAVHRTGAGFESWKVSQPLDLIELLNAEKLLSAISLPAGFYTQIRFVFDPASSYIMVGGEKPPLEVPSGEIKISANFQVQEGAATKLLLDFDAEKSIHVIGAGKKDTKNTKYILRPVIKVKSVSF